MDRLKTIESFLGVVRTRSFARTAEELGVSRGLVSKHVSTLERRLGVRLLNRSNREVALTEIGARYFETCRKMISALDDDEAEIMRLHSEPLGSLKLVVPKSFGGLHFSDAIAEFALKYPQINVAVTLDDKTNYAFSFAENEFDVAIRIAPLANDSAVAMRKLGTLRWVVCAAPSYLDHAGEPADPKGLAGHNCLIHVKLAPDRIWRFNGNSTVKVKGGFLSNSDLTIRRAALAGVGIAQLPTYYIAADLKASRLRQILKRYPLPERPVYALFPASRQVPHRVRLLVDFLAKWYRRAPWEHGTD
jgi:LysR family transcriptional regulator for bpeEF and oprC